MKSDTASKKRSEKQGKEVQLEGLILLPSLSYCDPGLDINGPINVKKADIDILELNEIK